MHSHDLNRGVLGYFQKPGQDYPNVLARGTAQWPQTFYHPKQLGAESDYVKLTDGDVLMARCIFDASKRDRVTSMGATNDDEMCNLYLMFAME